MTVGADTPPVRIGDVFDLGSATLDRDSIVAFASLYDPQPFHMDEEAARASVFGSAGGERVADARA